MLISCKSYTIFLFLKFLAIFVSGDLQKLFFPTDNILLNCGSLGNSTSLDGREWIGDAQSKFITSLVSDDTSPAAYKTFDLATPNDPVPFDTVRIFRSQLTYSFHISSGPKFVRFYFNPNSTQELNSSKAYFTATAGPFTLLTDFSPSSSSGSFVKEFCLNLADYQFLSVTLTPGTSEGAYGYINGIEVVSMPSDLYYPASGHTGLQFVGQHNRFFLGNSTALEMVCRLNVGGSSILPVNDSGMFRSWAEDNNLVSDLSSTHTIRTASINFIAVPSYAAPREVYQSARYAGKGMNLTWILPVDAGFRYVVRLHFCNLQQNMKKGGRKFQILIANQMAEPFADITNWTGGDGIPVFKDYCVVIPSERLGKKKSLFVTLQPIGKSVPMLKGLELFKINNTDGNLNYKDPAGFLAGSAPKLPEKQTKKSWKGKTGIFAILGLTAGVILVFILVGFTIFWYCKRTRFSEESTKHLPEGSCRKFTAEEIRNATNNFDRDLVLGDGGFGRVYKGCIDNENTPVAMKALKPTSSQGSREFWAEIEMISKLRHSHLVSLIGYCNDQQLMILVYEYMANGTLCNHLYHTQNPPLSWKQRLEICIGAARGLKYLHTGTDHCIIHRDIKSSNILLDENWVPKVSDFGLSRLGPTSLSRSHVTTEVKGTFGYLDPDYFHTSHLSAKSDVFSFGVLLFEVLCARPAVNTKLEEEQHSLAGWARKHVKEGTLDQIIDPNLIGEIAPECLKIYSKIAVKCLHDQKNKRPTMSNVLKKLELALKVQERTDFIAEEGTTDSGSESEEISLRQSGNSSGCLVHSCPNFWPRNSPDSKESYKFFSDRVKVNGKKASKPPSLRRLRGLFYAMFAYRSLPRYRQGQSTGSSTREPDLTSEKMLIEIMASQEL